MTLNLVVNGHELRVDTVLFMPTPDTLIGVEGLHVLSVIETPLDIKLIKLVLDELHLCVLGLVSR